MSIVWPWQEAVSKYVEAGKSVVVNVWETDDIFLATLMAPGLDEQTINVTVHEDTLSIEGALTFPIPEGARTVSQELGPAKFRRSLRLGKSVDPSRVEVAYRNGLLTITMQKAAQSKPRQIQVHGTSNEVKTG